MTRRFTRLVKESTAKPVAPVFDEKGGDEDAEKVRDGYPDLVLIDGGLGQLNSARGALADLGVVPPVVLSLAKEEETLFRDGKPIPLEKSSPALRLLMYVRDEAHRFAQHYHHQLRRKALIE